MSHVTLRLRSCANRLKKIKPAFSYCVNPGCHFRRNNLMPCPFSQTLSTLLLHAIPPSPGGTKGVFKYPSSLYGFSQWHKDVLMACFTGLILKRFESLERSTELSGFGRKIFAINCEVDKGVGWAKVHGIVENHLLYIPRCDQRMWWIGDMCSSTCSPVEGTFSILQ